MIRMIMHGCGGAMGRVITSIAAEDPDITIVAGIDKNTDIQCPYPVFPSLDQCTEKGDVIVDFSAPGAVDPLLDYCEANQIPVVLCTTGLTEEQVEKAKAVSRSAAVLRSANMSLGVNLLLKLVAQAARVLAASGFDMEIVEKHHNQKRDAPSGTALALAESLNNAMEQAYYNVFDRSRTNEKRDAREIGISAVRGGSIVGEHDVIFAGKDEVVTFSHTAYSKAIFAKGAVSAAKFLAGKGPGIYDMSHVIG